MKRLPLILFLLVVAAAAGFMALRGAARSVQLVIGIAVLGFLNVVGMVLFRDAIRDTLLGLHGHDVWARRVLTNWSVVAVFVAMLVFSIIGLAWLIRVVARAKAEKETYV